MNDDIKKILGRLQNIEAILKTKADNTHKHEAGEINGMPAQGVSIAQVKQEIAKAVNAIKPVKPSIDDISGLTLMARETPPEDALYALKGESYVKIDLDLKEVYNTIDAMEKSFTETFVDMTKRMHKMESEILALQSREIPEPYNDLEIMGMVHETVKLLKDTEKRLEGLIDEKASIDTLPDQQDHTEALSDLQEHVDNLSKLVKMPTETTIKAEPHDHSILEVKGVGTIATCNKPPIDNVTYGMRNGAWVSL